jgi:hypothetical protein
LNYPRFDSVSSSQRALFAEFQRQHSRLVQLVRWYDQQRSARAAELRRQFDQVNKCTRQQINHRSKIVIKERARVRHLLDDDINHLLSTTSSTKPSYQLKSSTTEKKRKVYGCLLPQFKAPLTKSLDSWSQIKSNSILSQSDYKKHVDEQRSLVNKFIESPIQQRNRMNNIINKCLNELEECSGDGYDHFLQTSEPNRNAQVLAQQEMNQKKRK